ncbi:unnamed protein product, partial [Amoebophrya sp. A120]
ERPGARPFCRRGGSCKSRLAEGRGALVLCCRRTSVMDVCPAGRHVCRRSGASKKGPGWSWCAPLCSVPYPGVAQPGLAFGSLFRGISPST